MIVVQIIGIISDNTVVLVTCKISDCSIRSSQISDNKYLVYKVCWGIEHKQFTSNWTTDNLYWSIGFSKLMHG